MTMNENNMKLESEQISFKASRLPYRQRLEVKQNDKLHTKTLRADTMKISELIIHGIVILGVFDLRFKQDYH